MREDKKRLEQIIEKLKIERSLLIEKNEFLSKKTEEQEKAIIRYTEKMAELLQKRFPKEPKPSVETH